MKKMRPLHHSWVNSRSYLGIAAEYMEPIEDLQSIKICSSNDAFGQRVTTLSFMVAPYLYRRFSNVTVEAGCSIIGVSTINEARRFSSQMIYVQVAIERQFRSQMNCLRGIKLIFTNDDGYQDIRHLNSVNSRKVIHNAF